MDYYHDIKFILEIDVNEYSIEDAFNNAKDILNWQFDENSNAIQTDGEIDYQIKDVSNLKESAVEEIIDSFFDFGFKDVIGVPLYRFLLLKDNEKQKILSIINSLIFDYSSINDFYELFENPEKSHPEYNQDSYHKDIQDYLNSSDFEKDSSYWKNHIQNSSRHIKFYNIKNNRYKSQKISPNSDSVSVFIENHGCSLFDFYGSIFSLYLSRIDRLDGCLLKTIIPRRIDLESFDRTTYLKIDVNNDDSFNDLLNEFNSTFKDALNHGKVDVDNYLDENVSYYSIYDFNDLNENIAIYNGEDSALTLNIYKNCLELVYNCELFSAEYISHMAKNIESLIHNLLNSPNQEISDVDILSDEEKSLLCDYCKGKTIEVDEDKILSQSFREYAIKNPDNIAVDDGISQISYGELEKSSNSIANDLQKNHEIKPGYRVGLMLPRNYHFPELILALNKIGAAYVPIEPSFPSNRIEHIINTARSEQLITTKDIADDFDVLDNSDDMGSEIINQILNDSNDFVTEFFVQLYQNGDDYSLTISHSNRYSERMINDFKDTYISVLSNIITADIYSNLNPIK